jgi:hypothetical protein
MTLFLWCKHERNQNYCLYLWTSNFIVTCEKHARLLSIYVFRRAIFLWLYCRLISTPFIFLVFIGIRIEVQQWTRLLSLGWQRFKNWEYIYWLNFTLARNFVVDSYILDLFEIVLPVMPFLIRTVETLLSSLLNILNCVYCFLPRLFVQKQKGPGANLLRYYGYWFNSFRHICSC